MPGKGEAMKLGIHNGGWYTARFIEQRVFNRICRLGLLGLPWNWHLGLGVIYSIYHVPGKFHIRILWLAFGWIKELP